MVYAYLLQMPVSPKDHLCTHQVLQQAKTGAGLLLSPSVTSSQKTIVLRIEYGSESEVRLGKTWRPYIWPNHFLSFCFCHSQAHLTGRHHFSGCVSCAGTLRNFCGSSYYLCRCLSICLSLCLLIPASLSMYLSWCLFFLVMPLMYSVTTCVLFNCPWGVPLCARPTDDFVGFLSVSRNLLALH